MKALIELFKIRETIFSLARNDFRNRYAGSYLGTLWAFIQPLMTILIFWFVFEVGFRTTPIQDVPYVVWFICGIIPWFYISESIMSGTMSIVDYSYIVKKVVFQIKILPLVKIIVSTFVHIFFIGLLLLVCFMTKLPITIYAIQIIYYSFCVFIMTLCFSYLTSALVPFSKDLGQFISIIIQFGFWLTPIVWNYEVLSPNFLTFFKLNPAFYIIQGYRDSLVYHVWFWERPLSTIYFWIMVIIVFFVGKIVFKKLKPHFADVL